MLKNTVWRQYHDENNFREKLAKFCKMDSLDLMEDVQKKSLNFLLWILQVLILR